MIETPLVSIIVPVYNVESFLDRCLDTIINQTYLNTEIIIVNDGSTDASPVIINRYCEKDSRIVIIDKPNGGLASARNVGVRKANGLYIWHIDSDDYFELNSLEKMVAYALNNSADVVISGYYKEFENSTSVELVECRFDREITGIEALKKMFQQRIGGEVWTKLYKRKLFVQYEIEQNENFSEIEDTLLNFQIFKVAKIVSPLQFYSVHHLYRNGSYSSSSKTVKFRIKHHAGLLSIQQLGFPTLEVEKAYYSYLFNDYCTCVLVRDITLLKNIHGFSFGEVLKYMQIASQMDTKTNISLKVKCIAVFSRIPLGKYILTGFFKFGFIFFKR